MLCYRDYIILNMHYNIKCELSVNKSLLMKERCDIIILKTRFDTTTINKSIK